MKYIKFYRNECKKYKFFKISEMEDDFEDINEYDYEQDIGDYDISKNPSYEINYEVDEDYTIKETHDTFNGVVLLKEDQLINERDHTINEAMEALGMGRDDSILALIYYNWSYEKLSENWFADVDLNTIKAGIKLSPQLKKKMESEGVESNGENCLVCFEEKNEDFACLSCGHMFCKDCWRDYLQEKCVDFYTVMTTKCPQAGCTNIVYEKFFLKYLEDPTSKIRFDKALKKNYTDSNDDIKTCPNPNCNVFIKCFDHIPKDVECICGTTFCFKCYHDSHRPCSCFMFEKWEKKNASESLDDKWVKANCKECPHCHQKIERSQGCNYMLCDKKAGGCGKAFCYVCEVDWAKHSQDHFNCNKYTDTVKNKEKIANKLKETLKRYTFYFDRYMNYNQAVKLCHSKLKPSLIEKMDLLTTLKNLPRSELKFIDDAFQAVVKGKRCLKNTYIFGYYLKDNKSKELFEFSQGYLEKNADTLHQLIEQDGINNILQHDDYEVWNKMFQDFRNRVLNLTNATVKYQGNLLLEIENNYANDIDQSLLNE